MERWDVFESERLEVRRGVTAAEVRAAFASGELRDDDLARPSGSSVPWARLIDLPELLAGPAGTSTTAEDEEAPDAAAAVETDAPFYRAVLDDEDFAPISREALPVPGPGPTSASAELGRLDLDLDRDQTESRVALPVSDAERAEQQEARAALAVERSEGEEEDEFDPLEEDEAAAEFSLSRNATETIEEIDLAPMVDVAFQLVLFFLVTATTVLFKTLEVPKPNPERPPEAGAQQAPNPARTLEDLQNDFIVVGIDASGSFTIDKEPVAADLGALSERLRKARSDTGRTSMLLTADAVALHRFAVLAYDAANEVGLKIAIARPSAARAP